MHKIKRFLKSALPGPFWDFYHYALAVLSAVIYGFPSEKIKIVGITGTKGKSTTTEYVNAILEKAGYKTAISSTIRFKIGNRSVPNKFKMTMPGRFFLQKLIKEAVKEKCDWVIIEMTSEGVKQFRHKFIKLDALIFTNISPEHIESHGSFEKYLQAKLQIVKDSLENSPKRPRYIIVNADSEHADEFLKAKVEYQIPISINQVKILKESPEFIDFEFEGQEFHLNQSGKFSVQNALLAISFANAVARVDLKTSSIALGELRLVPGRMEFIDEGQDFKVVVDYAHTPDSLEKLYSESFKGAKKICVLGNTGGGRDTWKRPVMAQIASKYCEKIILTDEDPYDEDPMKIIEDMKKGADPKKTIVVLDRRKAIRKAIQFASAGCGDTVLITGKGTDPYIMRANGKKEPWSDSAVAKEELEKLISASV